jgi:hypothetical protein
MTFKNNFGKQLEPDTIQSSSTPIPISALLSFDIEYIHTHSPPLSTPQRLRNDSRHVVYCSSQDDDIDTTREFKPNALIST